MKVHNVFSWMMVFLLLLACNKSDAPKPVDKPFNIREQISKLSFVDTITSEKVTTLADGVTRYAYSVISNKSPIFFYITQVDLKKSHLSFRVLTPNDANGFMLQPVKEMAEKADKSGHRIITATNGDYFYWTGEPWGPLVKKGSVLRSKFFDSWHGFFGIYKDGRAIIGGKNNFLADSLKLQEALGGTERLVNNYVKVFHENNDRHPRTFIGFNGDQVGYLVVADGRQAGHSIGMKLIEMSELMFGLKVKEALNLDGGGSTTLVDRDVSAKGFKVSNKYSDPQTRSVANALAIVDQSGN